MLNTIYDSSLITKRNANKAQSGYFYNNKLVPKNSTTQITVDSIIDPTILGKSPDIRKNSQGVIQIDPGCPCFYTF